MAARHISDARPDGTVIGQSATDLIAFYGGTPVVRATFSTTFSVTVSADASGNVVFSSTDAVQAMVNRINNLEEKLVTLGLAVRA